MLNGWIWSPFFLLGLKKKNWHSSFSWLENLPLIFNWFSKEPDGFDDLRYWTDDVFGASNWIPFRSFAIVGVKKENVLPFDVTTKTPDFVLGSCVQDWLKPKKVKIKLLHLFFFLLLFIISGCDLVGTAAVKTHLRKHGHWSFRPF